MTSREATGLMPLAGLRWRRSFADWLALLAFGAIQWPWLLRSLRGGSKAAKQALLDRLGLPQHALPHLGSWKADVGLLRLLVEHILAVRPLTVVEFGVGASTLVIARALQLAGRGRLIGFDQHQGFVDSTRHWLAEHGLEAELHAVPLAPSANGWPGLWYDHGPLPASIDLILIDGPPWTVHPFTRGAAETLFGRMAPGGTIMLDDGARPGERAIARRWKQLWPEFGFRLVDSGTKGTLVGTRPAEA